MELRSDNAYKGPYEEILQMSTSAPPTLETLLHGPPDAHKLIALVDCLTSSLQIIQLVVSKAIIKDEEYLLTLLRIKNIIREALEDNLS